MKYTIATILLLASLNLFSTDFIGGFSLRGDYIYLKVTAENDSIKVSLPYTTRQKFDFAEKLSDNAQVQFNNGADQYSLTFSKVEQSQVEVQINVSGFNLEILLKRQGDPVPQEDLSKYEGNYIDENGHHLIVYSRHRYLHMMSPYTEQTVSLKPTGENQFWSSTGSTTAFSDEQKGQWQVIQVTFLDGQSKKLKRSFSYTIEEKWCMVDKDSIYAKVFFPEMKGDRPACLLLPGGGGRSQIDNFEYEARLFASHGIVAMIFDKSGVGQSKGEGFEQYSFLEKSKRYEQLFETLRNLKGVNSDYVGVHGPSEGGRLALMMASSLKDKIAFVNATAAPLMTMKEGQLFAVDHYHRNLGVAENDIVTILNIWRNYYDGIIRGQIDSTDFEHINQIRSQYQRAFLPPLRTELPLSPQKEDLMDQTVVENADQIECPVFLQYGENDQRVNPYKSIQNFYGQIKDRALITTEVYDRGNHSMMTPEYQICSGYAYDKIKWLQSIDIIK